MGFGHRVYKTDDPRSVFLRGVAERIQADKIEFAKLVEQTVVEVLAELKPGRNLYANVEFYAGVVMDHCGLPRELFTPTFASSRGDRLVRQRARAGRRQPHHPAVGPLHRPAPAPARARRVGAVHDDLLEVAAAAGAVLARRARRRRRARPGRPGRDPRGARRLASSPAWWPPSPALVWLFAGAPGIRVAAWPKAGLRTGRARGDRHRRRHRPRRRTGPSSRRGRSPTRRRTSAPSATRNGRSLVVTDGARELLTRDQLEALCAAQHAIATDRTCRRLRERSGGCASCAASGSSSS